MIFLGTLKENYFDNVQSSTLNIWELQRVLTSYRKQFHFEYIFQTKLLGWLNLRQTLLLNPDLIQPDPTKTRFL